MFDRNIVNKVSVKDFGCRWQRFVLNSVVNKTNIADKFSIIKRYRGAVSNPVEEGRSRV